MKHVLILFANRQTTEGEDKHFKQRVTVYNVVSLCVRLILLYYTAVYFWQAQYLIVWARGGRSRRRRQEMKWFIDESKGNLWVKNCTFVDYLHFSG